MIPLFIDFSAKTVVIFGGGVVGARKASLFSREARVIVVSRSFPARFESLNVELIREEITLSSQERIGGIIRGAFLVIAALPDAAVNNLIGSLAREMGILFNNAEGEAGDAVVPSVITGSNYSIGISTHGMSPLVSRCIRELIERELPSLDRMIGLQDQLRDVLKGTVGSAEDRRRILEEVFNDPAVGHALLQGDEEAWHLVKERYLS